MDYILLIVGLTALLLGANYLVDASVAIAKRAKVSNFIIGLTIVGIGTSAPELFVSIQSALTGHGDIAIGNVVGSNIANLLLILGVTAVICPFAIEKQTHRSDIPFGIFAAVLLTLFVYDSWTSGIEGNTLSRLDGGVMLIIFIAYFVYTLFIKAKDPQAAKEEMDSNATSKLEGKAPALLWGIAAVSLAALLCGGQLFLNSSISLARAHHFSDGSLQAQPTIGAWQHIGQQRVQHIHDSWHIIIDNAHRSERSQHRRLFGDDWRSSRHFHRDLHLQKAQIRPHRRCDICAVLHRLHRISAHTVINPYAPPASQSF